MQRSLNIFFLFLMKLGWWWIFFSLANFKSKTIRITIYMTTFKITENNEKIWAHFTMSGVRDLKSSSMSFYSRTTSKGDRVIIEAISLLSKERSTNPLSPFFSHSNSHPFDSLSGRSASFSMAGSGSPVPALSLRMLAYRLINRVNAGDSSQQSRVRYQLILTGHNSALDSAYQLW